MTTSFPVSQVKFLATIQTGSGDTQDAVESGAFPFYVRSPSVRASDEWEFDCEAVLTAGDGAVGEVFHRASGRFMAHQRVYVLNNFKNVTRDFFYYAFSTFLNSEVAASSAKTTVESLRMHMVSDLELPVPPLETQRRIVDYLDRETAEMDAMSARLDDLIELLNDRFFTEIEMGVGWGTTPTSPVGLTGSIVLGKMLQPSQRSAGEELRPYLRAAHVQPRGVLDRSVEMKSMWFTPSEASSLDLVAGDVVIVEGGVGGYGRAAFVSEDLTGVGFQNSIVRVRPYTDTATGKFIAYALVSARYKGLIEITAATATMPHFTAEKVARFRIPLPPLDEQRRIVARLDAETAKIDAMIADARELKNLIAERRSALITEVVTGRKEI